MRRTPTSSRATIEAKQTGEERHLQMTSYVAGQRLKARFPAGRAQRSTRCPAQPVIMRGGEALPTEDVLLVDDLFFDVLQFPLVQGDPATRSVAARHGRADPERGAAHVRHARMCVGQTLTMVSRGISTDYRVTGVARDLPRNSHVRFTIVARIDIAALLSRDRRNS